MKTYIEQPVSLIRENTQEMCGNRVRIEDSNGSLISSNNPLSIVSVSLGSIDDGEVVGNGSIIGLLKRIRALLGLINITGVSLAPNIFKTTNAISVASETTIWTPGSGKRFRLMGGLLSITGAVGNILFKDGTGGSTVFLLPNILLSTPISFGLGEGILSGTANNVLTVTGVTLMILNGVVWGRED